MLDEALRQRLEALNRAALPEGVATQSVVERAVKAAVLVATRTVAPPPAEAGSPGSGEKAVAVGKPIPGLMRRGEVVATSVGEHLRIRLPLEAFWPGGERLVASRQEFLRGRLEESRRAVEPTIVMPAEFAALVAALPDRTLLLDLETCGLSGSALFLIGLLRQIDGTPTVELLLARNYAEEQAVLESLWQIAAGHDVLVTFNGKAFDWPMVMDRSIRHRLSAARSGRAMLHVDVLHHARRRWRRQLPDCRLQTLEQHVCRRRRSGDIPGHLIPAAYAEFVRTGFEREMDAILYHNAADLVTLLDLTLRLAG
jgi:uncharacterized protein YprB with RNaseH-like and TPR domain